MARSADRIAASDPTAAVREWFTRLGVSCRAVDYESARALFAPGVLSFGTRAGVVVGLDRLQANQWERIWPAIRDFQFDLDGIHAGGDTCHAWGVTTWTSAGFDEAGAPFARPGRATVVLECRGGTWQAAHTHFSLFPGTPPRTFGPGLGR